MTSILLRVTRARRPCNGRGRDGLAATSPGTAGPPEAEEAGGTLLLGPRAEHGPADTLISDFRPPELGEGQRVLSEADSSVWTFVMAALGIVHFLCVLPIDGGQIWGQVSSAGELGWGPWVGGVGVLPVPPPGHGSHPWTSGGSGGGGLGRLTSRPGWSCDERWLTRPRLSHESQTAFARREERKPDTKFKLSKVR